MQSIDILLETAREFLHQVAAFLPRLLLALVVVAIGWVFAKAARFAIERSLRAVNFTVLTERAGTDNFLHQAGMRGDTTSVFGLIAYWLVVLATLMIAFNGSGSPTSRICSAAWCCSRRRSWSPCCWWYSDRIAPASSAAPCTPIARTRKFPMPTCSAGLRAISS
jgi:hypothetical protein